MYTKSGGSSVKLGVTWPSPCGSVAVPPVQSMKVDPGIFPKGVELGAREPEAKC